MPSLTDYRSMIKVGECRWCGADLLKEEIKHYEHGDGWEVEGFERKQWLYIVCPKCGYQWALWKLGVPRGLVGESK